MRPISHDFRFKYRENGLLIRRKGDLFAMAVDHLDRTLEIYYNFQVWLKEFLTSQKN
jgi:hypothetical protein